MKTNNNHHEVHKPNTISLSRGLVLATLLVLLIVGSILISKSSKEKSKTQTFTNRVAVVNITANGFVPESLTVPLGTKITWVNSDQAPHSLGSNPYPENTDLPELKSGDIVPLKTYSITMLKMGKFGYHLQDNPVVNGSINVINN